MASNGRNLFERCCLETCTVLAVMCIAYHDSRVLAGPVVKQPPGLLRKYTGETASLSWLFSQTFMNGGTLFRYNGQAIYQVGRDGTETIPPAYTGRLSFSRTDVSVTLDLLAVNINDAAHGNYTLEQSVIGESDITDRKAEIFIYATPTISFTRQPSGDIIESQTVTFTCLVQPQSVPINHSLPIEYIWKRNDQSISLPLDRHSVHSISGGQELRINPVHRSDVSYQCVAQEQTSSLQAVSFLISIDVYYSPGTPEVSGVPPSPVIEGDSLTSITCSLPGGQEGNPAVYIYLWTNMDSSYSTETSDSKLSITRLNVSLHDGPWQCQVKNAAGVGSNAAFTLTVNASPTIQADLPDFAARIINESFSVSCTFRGRPEVSIGWLYNGMPSLPGGMTTDSTVISQDKYRVTTSTLTWSQATQNQRKAASGLYRCQASNTISSNGSTQMNFTSLFGPYDIVISPSENQTVVENDTVALTCEAECNPDCTYTWSFEGDRELKSTNVRKFQRGQRKADGELHIDSIGRNNHGWFTCEAKNYLIGSSSRHNIYISVNYPPDVSFTINPSGVLVQGIEVTVSCAAVSRPPDNTITWTNVTGGHPPYYDDSSNSTHSWVTITDIDILDTGELRCTADNGLSGSPRSQQRYMEVFGPARVHQTHPPNNRTGAGIGDQVSFQVSIIARPMPPHGNWSWMFVPENFTAVITIPGGVDLIVDQDSATLNISNVTAEHFGNYSLHTSNFYGGWDLGDVVFELIASGPPSRPTGFYAVRVTAVSITVEWMTGFDGGLPQTFTITYINIDSDIEEEMSDIPDECSSQGCTMQRKITEGIADNAEYALQISAANGRGQAMGDPITVSTPVRASLPQQPEISLRETEADVKFSMTGELTSVTIHHCVKDTENCDDDQFLILTQKHNNQRRRRQARATMYNFSETVDLVDPSASRFEFEVILYDGDDIIFQTESMIIDWPSSDNVGAIVGGVFGGLLLAALVITLVLLWRKGIIPIEDTRQRKSRGQSDHDDQQMVPRNKPGFSNLSFQKERVAESIYENTESSGILVSKFAAYVDHMLKGQKPFEEEYDDLPQGKQFDWDEASRHDDLKLKNRFRNVLPYDRNRVHLRTLPDDPYSDYINASYIKGYTDEDKMIATLGPMPATIDDFWRMVWEKESPLIVMLTNCTEIGNKKKCEQYWPRSMEGHPLNQGDIEITLTKEDVWPDYTIRTLTVTKNGMKRIVSHCHFTAWPDHGVPDCGTSLIAFRGIVAKKMVPGKYTVVHCSAGVGRTGTLIALDYLIKQAERENKVDVFSCVEELRMQRIAMVQISMQYVFIHTALAEYFTTGPTTIPCSDFNKYYLKISKPKKTGPSTTQNQMQMLNKLTPKITDADKDYPLEGVNSFKNRVPEIIPLLSSRVCLTSRIPGCNDYINAVYVNACKKKDAFIVTQVPLDSTIIDFWRLIEDFNSSTVVLLVTDQQYKTMPIFVPSTNNPCVVSNNKMARLTGSIDNFGYTTVKVDIGPVPAVENAYMNFEDVSKPVAPTFEPTSTMKIFIMHIPENKKCPDAKQTISMINDIKTWVVENQPHPITVACWDGAAYSGQFVACCNLMEMMSYEPEVDVYRIVKQIRDRRPQFINNLDQYHGVHHFVLQYLQEFSLYANVI